MATNIWNQGLGALRATLADREARARQRQLDEQAAKEAADLAAYRQGSLDLQRSGQEAAQNARLAEAGFEGTRLALSERDRLEAAEAAEREKAARLALLDEFGAATDPQARAALARRGMVELGIPQSAFTFGQQSPDSRSIDVQAAEALAAGDMDRYRQLLRAKEELGAAGRAPGGGTDPITNSQRLMIGRQAMSQAQYESREGIISPEDVQARAAELEYEQLTGLGVEAGPPPPSPADLRRQQIEQGPETPTIPSAAPPTGTRQDIRLPPSAAPVAPAPQVVGDNTGVTDEEAIAALRESGGAITPANIADAKRQLAPK